ncbi:MAG: Ig-like domain-containing protein [Oscillospiraceae bacterium]|jgi:uncharacterized protein YkwD|nr:Ig-like domain-containing protein [Oscillospiraceae bacterium]
MKLKKLISAALIFALAVSALPAAAFAATAPSGWAASEITGASTSGLLTDNAAKDFHHSMTRDEFCEIVVRLAEKTLGRELAVPARTPFSDARSEHVLKAYQYGLVDGVGNGRFDPDAKITREQIATLMVRALNRLQQDVGRTLLSPPVSELTFKDASKIGEYARESMRYAVANGIFKGDDYNNVNPLTDVNAEQCVIVAARSFDASQEKINAGLSAAQLIDKAASNINIGYALGDLPTAVSRDVALPTSGAGGVKITWSSSNSSVIDSSGRVSPRSGGTATLTATLTHGGLSRVRTFTLTTTTLTGDSLIIENAKAALELGFYNTGDSAASVTGNIFLPGSVLGLPISWSSDLSGVVSTTGEVTLPNDSREVSVNVQAMFRSGTASGTKLFVLKVRNPAYSSTSVSLHNVSLGMTASQVTSALGSYRTTLTLATGETWQLYYSSATSYNNFIAVAFQSNRVVGVYTMVQGWENYLRDANTSKVVTVSEVNGIENTSLTAYTDARSGLGTYAGFLADTSSTIDNVRTLLTSGAETFTLALINAFRARNSRSALVSDTVLATSARLHSSDMGQYSYFSPTGRTGNTTYQTRANSAATSAGATSPTVEGGFIGYNTINPFNYLDNAVNATADRSLIISSTATSVGAGFAGGYNGTYRDLLTVVFGRGTLVTSATLTVNNVKQTSVSVGLNSTQNIVLTFQPTNASESISVESSNTNVFSVAQYGSASSNTRTYTLTGRALSAAYGTTYLYVYGADRREIAKFTVTVGNTYASSLKVTGEDKSTVTTSASNPTPSLPKSYILGTGNSYQFTATAPAASGSVAPTVTWTSSNTAVNVSATGYVTASRAGTATIMASVPSTSGYYTVSITVIAVDLTLSAQSTSIALNGSTQITASMTPISGISGLTQQGYTWTTNNAGAVTMGTGNPVTIAGKAAGTATITATAVFATSSQYVWRVTKGISITVNNTQDYPGKAEVANPAMTLGKNETKVFTVTITPPIVKYKIISHTYPNATGSDLTVNVDANNNVSVTGNNVTSTPITFTIKVTAAANGSVFDIPVSVTVTKIITNISILAVGQPVTETLTMTAGDEVTLSATKTPSSNQGSVKWSIVDADGSQYATIDETSGRITALAQTSKNITVKARIEGTNDYEAAESTIQVKINPSISNQSAQP